LGKRKSPTDLRIKTSIEIPSPLKWVAQGAATITLSMTTDVDSESKEHLIKQEHRIEGLIVAEVCTTIVIIFLVTIQYVFKDCHDPKNLYKSVICVREEAIAAGWTGWWYNTSTAVFSLAFVLLYLPIFWTVRRIHLFRLGQNVKCKLHKIRIGQMCYVAYQLFFSSFLVTLLEERISKWLGRIIQLTRMQVADYVEGSYLFPNLECDYGKWNVYFFIVNVFFFANVVN
jgi:hypothetical protein